MNNPDPLVSWLPPILFLLLAVTSGLAEQYYLSLNENKLDYAARQGLSAAKLLQGIVKRRFPDLGDTIWVARYLSLAATTISAGLLIISFQISFPSNFVLAIGGTVIIASLLAFSPRFLQLRFKRKYIGQLFFSLQIGTYFVFALPTLFTVTLLRAIAARIYPDAAGVSLLVPIKLPPLKYSGQLQQEKAEPEVTLLQNALDFSKVRVRDCMVPRNEMVSIGIDDSVEDLRMRFIDTHFSKILVYKDTSDNIIGYVHSYELFKHPASIKNILMPVIVVPETANAQEVFELFVKQKRSIAVVLDEFGGTSGMVTVEDVIEEIFGEIDDEHDTSDYIEQNPAKDHYILSGRLEVDYLNEKYGLKIPESENYDTLAGFVVEHLEDIPEAKACFETELFLITVLEMSEARIDLIDLKIKEFPRED
ncbi:MAG: hemolysin family protein [Bacteroidota bacterium]